MADQECPTTVPSTGLPKETVKEASHPLENVAAPKVGLHAFCFFLAERFFSSSNTLFILWRGLR